LCVIEDYSSGRDKKDDSGCQKEKAAEGKEERIVLHGLGGFEAYRTRGRYLSLGEGKTRPELRGQSKQGIVAAGLSFPGQLKAPSATRLEMNPQGASLFFTLGVG
jgi:hypothetical protein